MQDCLQTEGASELILAVRDGEMSGAEPSFGVTSTLRPFGISSSISPATLGRGQERGQNITFASVQEDVEAEANDSGNILSRSENPSPVMSSAFCKGTRSKASPAGSSRSSSGVFCRICHEGDLDTEKLISPCACSGSVGLVHRTCIEKWLSTCNQDTCEICKEKFLVSRHCRPFTSWLLTPAVGDDQRNLVGDTVCFLLLTPLTTISAYLCASGAVYYMKQVKKSEAVGLVCLATLLVTIYMIWLLLTIRYHCQVWFKWRTNNQDIRLLDVTTNRPRPKQVATIQPQRGSEVAEGVEGSASVTHEDEVAQKQRRSSPSVMIPSVGLVSPSSPCGLQTPSLASIPLSPVVTSVAASGASVAATDQATAASLVVSSTPDTEVAAQLARPTPSYLCPYLPDLKEHFITIGSKKSVDKVAKSRGSFSPNPRHKTPFRHLTPRKDYERF